MPASLESDLPKALREMCTRVQSTVSAFAAGGLVLVGDDGLRENEADLVFHAKFASAAAVNAAITHARGLLCVSVGHDLADTLGFMAAPRIPADMAHTGFTISVDAKHDIGSGISAKDRGISIMAMVDPDATHQDFVSPGHVFPVRAHRFGLLARTGHTEALQELCLLAELPPAAAMCEVLGEDGEALEPKVLTSAKSASADSAQIAFLKSLPYVSTVDLLWYKVLFQQYLDIAEQWKKLEGFSTSSTLAYQWTPGAEDLVSCDAKLFVTPTAQKFAAKDFKLSLSDGFESVMAGNNKGNVELRLFVKDHAFEKLNPNITCFCDLSLKEGLASTQVAVRRSVTLIRALQFLEFKQLLIKTAKETLKDLVDVDAVVDASDKELLLGWAHI